MDIILLKNVDNLGNLGDKVNVRAGYGRNFLIPTGRAVPATDSNMKAFEERRATLEKEAAEQLSSANARKVKFDDLSITITCKSGDEGRLFGSVGTADIAAAATEAGVELSKKEIRLPDGPFRVAGEYEVALHLLAEVDATLKLNIVSEE